MIVDCTLIASSSSHFPGQAETGKVLRDAGIDNLRWLYGAGSNVHVWRVVCTEQDAVALALICEQVCFKRNEELEKQREGLEKEIIEIRKKISEINDMLRPSKVIAV